MGGSLAFRGTGSSGMEGERFGSALATSARGGLPRCEGRGRGVDVPDAPGGGLELERPSAGSIEVFSSLNWMGAAVISASEGALRTT